MESILLIFHILTNQELKQVIVQYMINQAKNKCDQ